MIKIIKQYNLCNYDHNMIELYVELKKFIDSEYNGNIVFELDERLVFIHQDLDFYISNNFPGFTLYNLQLILKKLNIPNFFCAVVSSLPNYSKYTELARQALVNEHHAIRGITSYWMHILLTYTIPVNDNNLNINSIKFPFITFNRASRFHRTFFMSKLFEKNLQTKGLISYHNINDAGLLKKPSAKITHDRDFSFISTQPFKRENSEFVLYNISNLKLVDEFQKNTNNFINFSDYSDLSDKEKSGNFQNSLLQKAFLWVATESTVTHPEPFVTEKTFKAIVAQRPFVVFGDVGSLQYVKNLGFKTFVDFWDESYDNIINIEDRANAIVDIIDNISNLSLPELQDMCNKMASILEHNFLHFTKNFYQQEKDKLDLGLQ